METAIYPAYNRYHPKPGPVARSLEYEIGDCSPHIRTVEWVANLVIFEGNKYLQLDTTVRYNGEVEEQDCLMWHDMVRVKNQSSIMSQAHKMIAKVTALALSAEQYRNKQ